MPQKTTLIGKEVLIIPFKGPQLLGKIVSVKDGLVQIETKAYGFKEIKKEDIRRIKD